MKLGEKSGYEIGYEIGIDNNTMYLSLLYIK